MGKTYTDFSQLSKGMFRKCAPVEEMKPLPKTKAVGGDDALSFFGLNAPETPTGASGGVGAGDERILALEADVRAVRAESAALDAAKAEAERKAGDLERQLAAERQMRETAEAERLAREEGKSRLPSEQARTPALPRRTRRFRIIFSLSSRATSRVAPLARGAGKMVSYSRSWAGGLTASTVWGQDIVRELIDETPCPSRPAAARVSRRADFHAVASARLPAEQ